VGQQCGITVFACHPFQFEQLLNLPDIQILNVEITEHPMNDKRESCGFS